MSSSSTTKGGRITKQKTPEVAIVTFRPNGRMPSIFVKEFYGLREWLRYCFVGCSLFWMDINFESVAFVDRLNH